MFNQLLKITLLTTILTTSMLHLKAQTSLIEEINLTEKNDGIIIPFKKFVLDNGLTIIIHEDDSDPLVHVDITYHVGSAREEMYKSGFAHFFEHMMFQGSENVADEEHFKIISDAGGTLNGSTNRDRTNYYQTVPSNQLEVVLWLEADRMGFFLDAVTQKKFEIQRETVKNEKGQNYDNAAYGRWSELTAETLYPFGHPYSWLTIGKLEDLDRVDVEDLKKFFMRWYGPNNATLTIGGNITAEEVIPMVEKYFGVIPRGPEVDNMTLEPVQLDADRYVSYVDNNIRFPALLATYPTVPRFHPDEAPLDFLAQILGTGRSSYLFKKFILTQKAIQASVFHPVSELAGEFTMFVLPFPGQTLADFEQEMRVILDEFATEGVSDNDLTKIKASFESSFINGLTSVSGKVSQLADYQTIAENANYIEEDLSRYLAVTKEDIMRVFNEYIYNKPGVLLSVLPNDGGATAPAAPDNYVAQKDGDNPFPTTDYSGLSYSRPEGDSFDRSVKPTPGTAPLVQVPDYWRANFENGIQLIGTESNEVPTVNVQLYIKGGHELDANDPQKAGLASLTAALMNESTQNYSSEEISEELRLVASSISVSGGRSETVVGVSTLSKNLTRTMELLEEILYRPAFTEEDFNRVKQQQLESIRASYQNPAAVASQIYSRLLYGDEHIYSVPTSGLEETVSRITVEDVRNFYETYMSPEITEVVVVGDISEEEALSSLAFLNNWETKNVEIPDLPEPKPGDYTKVYLMDKVGAPQSEIRIGYVSDMTYDATGEYFKTSLMNYSLGGAFNSRINLNLREDKGWTYGARSGFSGNDRGSQFTASAGIKASATDSAVVEFIKEIKGFQENGITDDELNFMRNSIGQRDARLYETPFQKAGFLGNIIRYDLDGSYVDRQAEIIQSITREEINALARKYLNTDNAYILVVGDGASNRDKLKALGYEVVDVTEKGDIIEPVQEGNE
ncbi:MAG: insulinase family protein [Balneolaceae bacterium]|nr:insulinase family protein [Balneolaceae bacterium]